MNSFQTLPSILICAATPWTATAGVAKTFVGVGDANANVTCGCLNSCWGNSIKIGQFIVYDPILDAAGNNVTTRTIPVLQQATTVDAGYKSEYNPYMMYQSFYVDVDEVRRFGLNLSNPR